MSNKKTASIRLEDILKQVGDQKYPPVHLWNPNFCGDIDMVIKRDGQWFYMGTPIERPPMVKLFASVLRLDDDGRYYLVTPVEKIGITVEDVPFIATQMTVTGEGADATISFETNVGDIVAVDKDHPLEFEINPETEEPRPYVVVRHNLRARLSRSVYYELVAMATECKTDKGIALEVYSQGETFALGEVAL